MELRKRKADLGAYPKCSRTTESFLRVACDKLFGMMTEETCWQAIDGELKALRDDLMTQLGRLREAPFHIKSLEETRNRSLVQFLDAALALPSRSHEDRLFLVEEILSIVDRQPGPIGPGAGEQSRTVPSIPNDKPRESRRGPDMEKTMRSCSSVHSTSHDSIGLGRSSDERKLV